MIFIVLARWGPRGFRLNDVFGRLELPQGSWQRLGLVKKNGDPITYRQLRYALERIGGFVDPFGRGIPDDERERRHGFLELLSIRLLLATVPRRIRRRLGKAVAVDGTLMWAWGKPTDSPSEQARGARLNNSPQSFENCVSNDDFLPPEKSTIAHSMSKLGPETLTRTGKRKRRPAGAERIGHKDKTKQIFGYAHHVTTLTPGPTDEDMPLIAIGLVTTPAPWSSTKVGLNHIPTLFRELEAAGFAKPEELAADAAYSVSSQWFAMANEQGVDPVSRLNRAGQEGFNGALKGGDLLLIDGRPHCKCCPDELRSLVYPYEAWKQGNDALVDPYLQLLHDRSSFELARRGRQTFRGAFTFTTPHFGGTCPRCRHLPDDRRCCRQKTYRIRPDEIPLYQEQRFGTPEWQASYSSRSRIEGYFSQLKSADIVNFTRLWAKFTDFGKIALSALFAMIAINSHAMEKFLDRENAREAGKDDGRKARKERAPFETFGEPAPQPRAASTNGAPRGPAPPPGSRRPSQRGR